MENNERRRLVDSERARRELAATAERQQNSRNERTTEYKKQQAWR